MWCPSKKLPHGSKEGIREGKEGEGNNISNG